MEKKKKKSKVARYVVGTIALFAATAVAVPVLLPKISGKINKSMTKRKNAAHDDDDWGPVIEKKNTEKENADEN